MVKNYYLRRRADSIFSFAVDYEPVINEVDVPVVGRKVCNSWLEENNVNVTDTMICAGLPEGGRDACQVNNSLIIHAVYVFSGVFVCQSAS
jgi:Trypsin